MFSGSSWSLVGADWAKEKPVGASLASASTSARGANARTAGERASARTSASKAHARSAGRRASVRTIASGASARSAGGRASARTSARGAGARTAGERASARTSASGARARSAARSRKSRCQTGWRSSEKSLIAPQLIEVNSARLAEGTQRSSKCREGRGACIVRRRGVSKSNLLFFRKPKKHIHAYTYRFRASSACTSS